MTAQLLKGHYNRLLTLWPSDPLRPTLPLTNALQRRGTLYGVTPLPQPDNLPSKKLPETTSPAPQLSADAELANINALYSLLENRYSKTYKLSPGVLKPASNPEYYERLMEEIARAPTKTWWQAKMDNWKGMIRWQ